MKPGTCYLHIILITLFIAGSIACHTTRDIKGTNYYLSNSGNDSNSGTREQPWKSIARLNKTFLNPGDTVFFSGGQIFTGSILIDSTKIGSTEKPVVITSSAADQATVQSGNNMGITVYNTS